MAASVTLPSEQNPAWHTLRVDEALNAQGVEAASGLSQAEAGKRFEQHGPNRFAAAQKEPAWHAFLRQYQDPMQIVLVAAGVVSGLALLQWGTALVLWALTLLNAVVGLRQEGKAEASVAALQKMMIVKVRVRRDGLMLVIAAEDLVPGDIVVIEAGDRIPADGRIIKAANLEIDESALTGESVPVPKQVEPVPGADKPLGDRADMAYMNTNATRGAGEFVVTATGMATEVGHISRLLQTTKAEQTPLTRQLNRLSKQIVFIAGMALLISILLGYSRGQTLETLFLTGVAFAVSAIPTGLPAIVTFLLATGTTRLAREGAIVKQLRSVETLGATSAINTDKTGTLTLNQMTAVSMAIAGRRVTASGEGYATTGQITQVGGKSPIDLGPYLLPMVLASDAVVKQGELVGDPTEGALVVFAAKGGIDAEATRQEFPRLAEVPFDAAYKLMATFHRMQDEDGYEVIRCFVKGAPDQLLARLAGPECRAADHRHRRLPRAHHGRERALRQARHARAGPRPQRH
jgi:P-type Ca2+ transporter type 2C